MKDFKLTKFLFKILPFLISIVLGFIVFFVYYNNEALSTDTAGLLNEIAGALISVPIVFIAYELVSAFSDRRLKEVAGKYARINIDDKCRILAETLANNLKVKEFNEDLFTNKTKLKEIIKKSKLDTERLHEIYEEFNKVLRNRGIYDYIESDQLRNILRLNNNITYLIYEIKRKSVDNIAIKLEKIQQYLDDWEDYTEESTLYKS